MASVYSLDEWKEDDDFEQYDFCYRDITSANGITARKFFYARAKITDSDTAPESDTAKFFGYKNDAQGTERAEFIFVPSYSNQANSSPRTNVIQFGDGYESRQADGLSSNLLSINLSFDLRTEREATAILHFLRQRNAEESFIFSAPPPYNAEKLYVCRQWQSTFNFFDNYTISAAFNEVIN